MHIIKCSLNNPRKYSQVHLCFVLYHTNNLMTRFQVKLQANNDKELLETV